MAQDVLRRAQSRGRVVASVHDYQIVLRCGNYEVTYNNWLVKTETSYLQALVAIADIERELQSVAPWLLREGGRIQ